MWVGVGWEKNTLWNRSLERRAMLGQSPCFPPPLHIFLASRRRCINSWWKWLILKYNKTEIHLTDLRTGMKTPLSDNLAWFSATRTLLMVRLCCGWERGKSVHGNIMFRDSYPLQLRWCWQSSGGHWPKGWMACTAVHTHSCSYSGMRAGELRNNKETLDQGLWELPLLTFCLKWFLRMLEKQEIIPHFLVHISHYWSSEIIWSKSQLFLEEINKFLNWGRHLLSSNFPIWGSCTTCKLLGVPKWNNLNTNILISQEKNPI